MTVVFCINYMAKGNWVTTYTYAHVILYVSMFKPEVVAYLAAFLRIMGSAGTDNSSKMGTPE